MFSATVNSCRIMLSPVHALHTLCTVHHWTSHVHPATTGYLYSLTTSSSAHSVCEHTGTQSWSVGLPCALCPFANRVSVNQWVRLKGLCSPERQQANIHTWTLGRLHRRCGAVSVLCYYSVGIENGESAHTQWYSVWGALETWRRQV